jgi:hypothetical protein
MDQHTFFDRLRARAEGRLTPDEAAALERELAADPTLERLAEDYRLVHALTGVEPWVATSRLSLEALEGRVAPSPWRRVAAAAGILLLGAGAFLAGRLSRSAPAPLALTAIELDEPLAVPTGPVEVPTQWASYDPRGAEGVRFLRDRAEATALAAALGRPLLVFGSFPGCPLCAELDERVFADPAVAELAERVVPLRIDLAQLSETEQRSLTMRGYPFLEVWRADGRTAHILERRPDPELFLESLHDGLEKSDATGEQPPWDRLRLAASAFGAARAAELDGRLAEAERQYRALAEEAGTPAPIVERAQAGRQRIGADARDLLLEARTRALVDVRAAEALLAGALARFEGTSYSLDLSAVLARLRREGRFPALVEADRSV